MHPCTRVAVLALLLPTCNGGGTNDTTEATTTAPDATTSTSTSTPLPTTTVDDPTTTAGTQTATSISTTTPDPTTTTDPPPTSTTTTTTDDLTSTTHTDSTSASTGATDLPNPVLHCSTDLHSVLDEMDQVVVQCAPDEGCLDAACVPACTAAAASGANFGCGFIVPTPPAYPPALPPCFAVFLANTWGHPAQDLTVARGGAPLDITQRRAPGHAGPASRRTGRRCPPEGLPADSVAVVFLSSDPNAIMPENQVPLTCPSSRPSTPRR
jgi:hypothetical protein